MEVTAHEALARFGHALSDATRVGILLALRRGSYYPADLAEQLGVSKQNLSNHLACLKSCGLITSTPEGRRNKYTLADAKLAHALEDVLGVVLTVDSKYCYEENNKGIK